MAAVMRRALADLLYGTIVAAAAGGISALLALVGYGRPYYLSVFLPVSALCCLLVAWILHLREDRFLDSPSAMRGRARQPGDADSRGSFRGARRALLWAAAELALAATLLYFLLGVGASFG